jgi:ribosomal protein S18 acetylase RimI-like enzyme
MNRPNIRIVPALEGERLDQIKELFREYWAAFGFSPCFQGFSSELDALPGNYSPPGGRLLLALVDGAPAGCIALRPHEETRCEAKRLWVKPEYRGQGIGKKLMERIIEEARLEGYRELLGDTMPYMTEAISMYDRLGFERGEAYLADPTPCAIPIRLVLLSGPSKTREEI